MTSFERVSLLVVLSVGIATVALACGSARVVAPIDDDEDARDARGSDGTTSDGTSSVRTDGAIDSGASDGSTDGAASNDASDAASDSGAISDAAYDGPFEPGVHARRSLATGSLHSCVIRNGGTVKCWGSNEYGQLGAGTDAGVGTKSNPVAVPGLADVIEVTAGYGHSCALISGGTVKCWGRGNAGQLGDGLSQSSPTPRTVKDLPNATGISSHWDYSCALRDDKHIACWGGNGGRIGDDTITTRPAPTEPIGITDVVTFAAAWGHTTVVRSDGTAKAWGTYNNWGQIGDGYTAERLKPVDVLNMSTGQQIASGSYHSCAIVAGGTVRCWGNAQAGAIGLGVQDDAPHPIAGDVSGLSDIRSLGLGGASSCAITKAGKVYCWGNRTGHPTTASSTAPIEITSLSGALEIIGNNEHMCALFTGGIVKCWGDNSYNQLGNSSGNDSQTPVTVPGL